MAEMQINSRSEISLAGRFEDEVYFSTDSTSPHFYTGSISIDMLLMQYDSAGNFKWAKHFPFGGGISQADPSCMVIDDNDDLLIVGNYRGLVDLDPSVAVYNLIATSSYGEGFIAKYDSLGSFVWANPIHGNLQNRLWSGSFNTAGEIYVFGDFIGNIYPDPLSGLNVLTSLGVDGFFCKYDVAGGYLWSARIGNTGSYFMGRNILTINNQVYISGIFSSDVDFDPSSALYVLHAPPHSQLPGFGFLVRYSEILVGAPDITLDDTGSVWPNPCSVYLNLEYYHPGDFVDYEIVDVTGKCLKKGTLFERRIKVEDLSNGMYFLRLSDGQTLRTKKFIRN